MYVYRLITSLAAGIALACAPVLASAAQKIVAGQSEVAFTSKQMGVPVQGKFERFAGQVNVDPAKPETGKVSFTVDLASAAIGTAEAAAELKKPDWFNVTKFPSASFQSDSIKPLGNGKIDVFLSGKMYPGKRLPGRGIPYNTVASRLGRMCDTIDDGVDVSQVIG